MPPRKRGNDKPATRSGTKKNKPDEDPTLDEGEEENLLDNDNEVAEVTMDEGEALNEMINRPEYSLAELPGIRSSHSQNHIPKAYP
jgi:hypothetical protein